MGPLLEVEDGALGNVLVAAGGGNSFPEGKSGPGGKPAFLSHMREGPDACAMATHVD